MALATRDEVTTRLAREIVADRQRRPETLPTNLFMGLELYKKLLATVGDPPMAPETEASLRAGNVVNEGALWLVLFQDGWMAVGSRQWVENAVKTGTGGTKELGDEKNDSRDGGAVPRGAHNPDSRVQLPVPLP